MPNKSIIPVSILASSLAFAASAADFSFDEEANGTAATFSVWGQGVFPTSVVTDGDDCTADPLGLHCDNAGGIGAYAGVLAPLGVGWDFYGDLTFDYHQEADENSSDDPAIYTGLGAHFINNNGAIPWGVFAMGVGGHSHGENDAAGPGLGGGIEFGFGGNSFVQVGGIKHTGPSSSTDTFDEFYFLGAGGSYGVGNGTLDASLYLGSGDIESDDPAETEGTWVQLSVNYSAPLGASSFDWFVGLQSDYFADDETLGGQDEGLFNTVKVGITIPVGDRKSPFKTPNLRVPVTYSAETN